MATRYTDEFESSVTAWNTFPVLSILYHLSITFNSLYLWFKRTISVSSKILFNKTPLCSEVAIIFHNNYVRLLHTNHFPEAEIDTYQIFLVLKPTNGLYTTSFSKTLQQLLLLFFQMI